MVKKHFHKKLVRDKIPEIIKKRGGECEHFVLNDKEFRKLLKEKLVEESKEVVSANRKELVNELADVLQLVKSLGEAYKIPFSDIEKYRKSKGKKAGTFKKRIFLVWSDKRKGFGDNK